MWLRERLVSSLIFLLLSVIKTGNSELYSAQVDIDNLFVLEKLVAEQVELYLLREESRLQEIRKSFEIGFGRGRACDKGVQADTEAEESSRALNVNVNGDPIRNFVVVRRLVNDLSRIISIAGDGQNYERLQEDMDQLRKSYKFPDQNDLIGTGQALRRAQETYKLETSELANGIISGRHWGLELNADDCFELGKQSYGSNEFVQSINWLMEALKRVRIEPGAHELSTSSGHANDVSNISHVAASDVPRPSAATSATTAEILQYLEWAQNINQTLAMAKAFVGGDQFDGLLDEVAKVYESVEGNPKVEEPYRNVKLKYEALCRKDVYNTNLFNMADPPKHEQKCYYHYGRGEYYYKLGPMKEEVVSTSPLVIIFHDVVLDGEIKILQGLAKPMFQRSGVITSSGGTKASNVRTGKVAWLADDVHPVIQKLNRRMTALTHFDLTTSEELQIVNYGSGGQYEPHFDFYYGSHEKAIKDDSGNRIATLLIYMSDVVAGGATVFPTLNLSVQPRKGAGLFWYNLLDDGTGDYRTRHGACPVLVGSKWVANKWIHERCNSKSFQFEEESR